MNTSNKRFLAWIPLIALAGGFLIGIAIFQGFRVYVPLEIAPYLSVAALVGLDTVFGGVRAGIEGRFQNDIFISGFVLNTLLAAGLVWFGARIGVDFGLVSVLVLGSRIFLNLSLIRRFYLNKRAMARNTQREESAVPAVPPPNAPLSQTTEIGTGL